VFLTFFELGFNPFVQRSVSTEYQIKAVFLYNFTQFTEWPAEAFTQPDAPLIIGILGKDPFGRYLDETVAGEKISGHPLVVQRFNSIEDIKTCHILFINTPEKKVAPSLESLSARSILTVSDINNFAKQGGMITFVTENNKTRIQINLEATKKANIALSAKLLKLAEIVSTGK
jgi:hypothetical protein